MHLALRDAVQRGPSPGNLAAAIAAFGDAEVEFYAPKGEDPQSPHDRDELYFIVRGNGVLRMHDRDVTFEAGDMLFVPAHADHRFTAFSGDFATWVVFFGPQK